MTDWRTVPIDLAVILLLIAGLRQFRTTRGARWGNLTGALAMACAVGAVVVRTPILSPALVAAAFVAGGLVGWVVARRVTMIQVPAMVAFQHGFGGMAAALVSFLELARGAAGLPLPGRVSGMLGLILGAATFSGSLVAGAKLARRMRQTPVVLAGHDLLLIGLSVAALALAALLGTTALLPVHAGLAALAVLAMGVGLVFSVRVGGADMPVLISFLNATAGFAAALCGIVIQNRLLIACGATVAASGSILTRMMCVAMNRSLVDVLIGSRLTFAPVPPESWLPYWPKVVMGFPLVSTTSTRNCPALGKNTRPYGSTSKPAPKHMQLFWHEPAAPE